ncbi:unnamed protein product [Rotaria sp. Silwood2]|nr:unnamed protein product [Rotaria sp. Silwood2]CAF4612118.1 unnamed protein product [Rotaria sp. Silwood2]
MVLNALSLRMLYVSLSANIADRSAIHGSEQHSKLIVVSSFTEVPEPANLEQRKAYYYTKSPTNYALKMQIACDFHHRIVHVSECYIGRVNDIKILKELGLLEHVEEYVKIIADKEYIGEEYIVTQIKKPYGCELTDEDKNFNRDIHSATAAIVSINQRRKTYAIRDSVYRGAI